MEGRADREHDRLWREVERLRDRMHAVEGYRITLDALLAAAKENGRKVRELQQHVNELDDDVRSLVDEDRIASGVAAKLDNRTDSRLRRWSLKAAIVGAVVAGVGELVTVIRGALG